MTISKKLYLGIAVFSAILVALSVVFIIIIEKGHNTIEEVKSYPEVQAILGTRTIDHYELVNALMVGTALFGKEFNKATDPTKCDLVNGIIASSLRRS